MVERLLYQWTVQEELPFSRDDAFESLVRIWMRTVYAQA
jgi:hypothetical protein